MPSHCYKFTAFNATAFLMVITCTCEFNMYILLIFINVFALSFAPFIKPSRSNMCLKVLHYLLVATFICINHNGKYLHKSSNCLHTCTATRIKLFTNGTFFLHNVRLTVNPKISRSMTIHICVYTYH